MLNPMQVLTFAPCQDDIRAAKVYVHFPPQKAEIDARANLKEKLAWQLEAGRRSPVQASAPQRTLFAFV
jgi:hypothetical protein